jgi:hypothetical protein
MNLNEVELELKKRIAYPYSWGRKQNNYHAEISLIKSKIEEYINNFDKDKLVKISPEKDITALSDIIWVVK